MTEQRQDPPQSSEPLSLSPEQVAAYLHAHPEFFVDRDELLGEMRIPHQPGDAVSLVERQVACCASATSRCAIACRS